MKFILVLLTVIFAPAAIAKSADATKAESPNGKLITQDKVVNTFSDSMSGKAGLGIYDSSYLITGQSLSLILSSKDHWFQVFLGVHRAGGSLFEAGIGASYKFTVAGDRSTGLHLGPGFSIGAAQNGTANNETFRLGFFGLVGGHFTLFEKLMLSVDGGPNLVFLKGQESFTFRPAGAILGLGIHYLFY